MLVFLKEDFESFECLKYILLNIDVYLCVCVLNFINNVKNLHELH